ncbi:uncharacterized protein V1513DRAFT_430570 [Lipomyces chichibuensis]|uniref:uncharacterized protein n=1 Tax=Lipomyces chichibuensis TaxID=1546026 RepID=UPI00334342AC
MDLYALNQHFTASGADTEIMTYRVEPVHELQHPEVYAPLFTLGTSMPALPALPEQRLGHRNTNGGMAGTPPTTDQSGQEDTMVVARRPSLLAPTAVRAAHNQQGPEERPQAFIGPLLPTTCNPANLFIVKPLTPDASPMTATAALPELRNSRPHFAANFSFPISDELAMITPQDLPDKSQRAIASEFKYLRNSRRNGSQYDWCTADTEPDPEFVKLSYIQAEYGLGNVEVNGQPLFLHYTPQVVIVEPEQRDLREEYEAEHVSAYKTIHHEECENPIYVAGNEVDNKKNDDNGVVDCEPDDAPENVVGEGEPEMLTVNFVIVEDNKKENGDKDFKKVTDIERIENVVQEDSDYEDGEKCDDDESDYEDDQPRKRRRSLPKKLRRVKNEVHVQKSVPKPKASPKLKPENVPPPLTESEKRKSAHFIYLPDTLLNTLSNSVYPSRLNAADFASDVIVMANPTEHMMYAPPQLPNMDAYRRCEPYLRHLARAYRIRIDDIAAEITTAELDRYFTHVSLKRKKPKNITLTEDIGKAYFQMAYQSGVPGCVDIVISAAMHLTVKLNEYGHDEAKRPENLFIKFKNGLQDKILRVAGDEKIDRSKISTLAGFMEWKFSDMTKNIFSAIQGEIAELHKMVHPDYKYKPRKRQ